MLQTLYQPHVELGETSGARHGGIAVNVYI